MAWWLRDYGVAAMSRPQGRPAAAAPRSRPCGPRAAFHVAKISNLPKKTKQNGRKFRKNRVYLHIVSTNERFNDKRMKDFLKHVGATVVGLFLFSVVVAGIGIMAVVGMVASASSTRSVASNSVLVLTLDGPLAEQSEGTLRDQLTGDSPQGLREMLAAVRKAKANDDIKGIYIEAGDLDADMAQAEELRGALMDFRKSGKWIVAYGEEYSQLCYYLATTANKIYMNPQGLVDWHGLGGQVTFLRDAYAKIGIKMVPFKCGKYKSATETYTEDRMSAPSRQQTERYLGGWWNAICQAVGRSRGISVDSLNAYADRVVSLEDPKNMVRLKMVDALVYDDQVKPLVNKLLKQEADDDINQITVADMADVPEPDTTDSDNEVAVYYAYGEIVDEVPTQSLFTSGHLIVGKDVCRDLASLADDDQVKAVVIRINSGGGSSYASEQLWHQIGKLRSKKPVVVSMGGAAASGGYYMACGANYIFAEPGTITGSIGIYGLRRDRTELMTRLLGFKYDEVKTNRNATMGSEVKPMTPEQAGYVQAAVDRGYLLFKSRVAQGRRMTMAQVEERAQGHVFLGSDALKLGLVDALGGVDQAVAKAARLARLDDYYTAGYPAPKDFWEQLLDESSSSTGSVLDGQLRQTLGSLYEPFMLMRAAEGQSWLQARMPLLLRAR